MLNESSSWFLLANFPFIHNSEEARNLKAYANGVQLSFGHTPLTRTQYGVTLRL